MSVFFTCFEVAAFAIVAYVDLHIIPFCKWCAQMCNATLSTVKVNSIEEVNTKTNKVSITLSQGGKDEDLVGLIDSSLNITTSTSELYISGSKDEYWILRYPLSWYSDTLSYVRKAFIIVNSCMAISLVVWLLSTRFGGN